MAEYREISLDEAIALADAGAAIYRKNQAGILYKSIAWQAYSNGSYELKDIDEEWKCSLFVKVETYEP